LFSAGARPPPHLRRLGHEAGFAGKSSGPIERSSATTYRFDPARPAPSIGGNVSSLRDMLPLPPGLADPSYAGRGERTADVMRPGGFDQREAPGFHGCGPLYPPSAWYPLGYALT